MNNVRDEFPGESGNLQNPIGPKRCGISGAKYIPPNVSDMSITLSLLEKYINSDE